MAVLDHENFLLAEKLRQEDPDQFYILVRMHLSFVLDLNTDECDSNSEKKCKAIKWSLPFTKKQKPCSKSSPEGTILTSEFITQIHPIIEFLSKEENISQEGIFRRSGRVTRQQELKLLLQQGAELNFNNGQFSVHECATVLKNILSELPESVLTDGHYPAYCQVAELCGGTNAANKEKLLMSIQLLILLLPSENRRFFQEIIELLHLAVGHEEKNRMSAENLATLFTPHLLCPRRLSPEAFHTNSQIMSRVVAFMIEKGSELFKIPPTVATDVRAYWDKKEKKKLSPLKQMNESVCDGAAANTVFTFVDRDRTAQENRTNPTETALAQLYAYIQSLPESSKKRKLVKQFNKENGYGTPLSVVGKKRTKALNLGDSIKKHLSGFGKTAKRNTHHETAGDDDEVTSPEPASSVKKVQFDDEKPLKENVLPPKHPVLKKNSSLTNKKSASNPGTLFASFDEDVVSNSLQGSNKSYEDVEGCGKPYKKNAVACNSSESISRTQTSQGLMVKLAKKRNSSSPVKLSPCKSPRISDEYLVPNLVAPGVCASQEQQSWPVSNQTQHGLSLYKSNLSKNFFGSAQNLNDEAFRGKESFLDGSCKTPRRAMSDFHLCENFADDAFETSLRTPGQKFNTPAFARNTNNNGLFSSPNNTNRLPILCGPKSSFLMATSTPAPGNGCLVTPVVDKNNSMSPITKSARRMPKAMQETMMTPRSRKPVISLSSTDLSNLANADSLGDDDSQGSKPKLPNGKRLILEEFNEETGNDSLSSTFRNYLFSRSVLTASPVDLSFSSRTDDFLSLSDKSSSGGNENYKSLPEILNEAGLSESLLYCLDGNEPESDSGGNESEAKVADCSCSFSDCDENLHHVYETAL